MSMRDKLNLHKEDIIDLYKNQGKSCRGIAKMFNTTHNVISNFLKLECKIEIKNNSIDLTKEETKIIELYSKDKMSSNDIAKLYDVSGKTILKILHKNNVKITTDLEKHKDFIIDSYNQLVSADKIAELIGSNKKSVLKYLHKNNVSIRQKHGKYNINSNFFQNIDNEEKAYWLGFLYADGSISQKGNYITLVLAIKDANHVLKFKRSLEADNPIVNIISGKKIGGFPQTCLRIGDKKLHNDLIKAGCIPNKSLILEYPSESILPRTLERHFIRGYLDGDGSIGIYRDKPRIRIEGTKEFLNSIFNVLQKNLNVSKHNFTKRHNNNSNNYTLTFGGKNNVINVLNYLYKDSMIALDRKYGKYLDVKDIIENKR